MRKNIIRNIFTSFVLGALLLGGITGNAISAKAAETDLVSVLNVQSGYKTGFFGEVSKLAEKKGATVEFDLYESNLKDVNYVEDFDVGSVSGTSGSLACVSFVFGKTESYPYSTAPATPAWHISNADLTEYNFGGFQYFCNGVIKEWSYQGNSKVITNYIGDPSQFMEEGYSYKVSLRYSPFEYEGDIYGNSGEWFCVERKDIFEDDSAYKVLFAYQKALFAGANFTNGGLAGMEVQGLCINANVSGLQTAADKKGASVNLEIGSLKIYDGASYDDAKIKSSVGFDSVTAEDVALPDYSGKAAQYNTFGDKNYLAIEGEEGEIRCISTNFGSAIGNGEKVTAKLGVSQKKLFNVNFKDADTQETVATQKTYTGKNFSAARIEKDGKVYKFDYSGVNFEELAADIDVFGTPVSYFTLKLVSGTNDVNDKTQRVSIDGKYEITENSLVRTDYNLLGFATTKNGEVVYEIGDVVDMHCQDLTLYAVWELKTYTASYMVEGKLVYQGSAIPRGWVLYDGVVPVKEGYIFVGWDKAIAPATEDVTLNAMFEEVSDLYLENKALSVTQSFTLARSSSKSYQTVEIVFDALKFPAGAELVVCGQDISQYVREGYKVKLSLAESGSLSVYTAYVNSDEYQQETSVNTGLGTNASVTLAFDGNGSEIVIDNLISSYDGKNAYAETFDGEAEINSGVYKNYYLTEGSAMTVDFAQDITVTFHDKTTGRDLAVVHTYQGGNVALLSTTTGVSETLVWDKEQTALHNLQESLTVNGEFNWDVYTVSFVVTDILGYMPVEHTIESIDGIYGEGVALPTHTVGNYAIIGWAKKEGGFAQYVDEYVFHTESVTLYAVWGGKPLQVSFYAEDGETLLGNVSVEYNGTAVYEGEIPEKEGYSFVGWDKPADAITEDVKLIAQYEKTKKRVSVSVLGGEGAGVYTEGETVTIRFYEGSGYTSWKVVSGNVTITNTDGAYTFVVGAEDVVIQASGKKDGGKGCSSAQGLATVTLALAVFGGAVACKRKKENV